MLPGDLRYALRALARRPGFTVTAVLILALGVGATSAVFSIAEAALWRGLPFLDPERLLLVSGFDRETDADWPVSYLDVVDWRTASQTFDNLEIYSAPVSFNLVADDRPERVAAELVSPGYFSMLGCEPVLGRAFSADDNARPPRQVVLLSHDLWRSRFGGDAALVGRPLRLNGQRYEVLGVLPASFRGLTDQAQIWLPLSTAAVTLGPHTLDLRQQRWLNAAGRLKVDATVATAGAELETLARRLEEEYPNANRNAGVRVTPLVNAWLGALRLTLGLLLGASLLVLAIACTNIASLLLVRALTRQREISLRTALGAPRRRIMRQLLTESVVLTVLGGLAGLLLAYWATGLLMQAGGLALKSFVAPAVGLPVIVPMLIVAALSGLIFGLAPAWISARTPPGDVLRQGGVSGPPRQHRFLQLLVVTQIALALVLVVGAGLMIERFRTLRATDLGYALDDVMTLRIDLKEARYKGQEPKRLLTRQLFERLQTVPGVAQLALAGPGQPGDDWHGAYYTVDERQDGGDGHPALLSFHFVSPGYFALLGTPLRAGRDFDERDNDAVAPVTIVSESMARRFWPGESPVGKRLKIGRRDSEFDWHTVVGMVGDMAHQGFADDGSAAPAIYYSMLQYVPGSPPVVNFLARSDGVPAATLAAPLRRAVLEVDPYLPAYDAATLAQRLGRQLADERFTMTTASLFAGLALILAALGLYGVMQATVLERRREIGVRMALGAGRGAVMRLVVGRGVKLAVFGLLLGLPAVWGLARLASSFVHDLPALDPLLLGGTVFMLIAVAAAASLLPAHRASRLEPVVTLRPE